MPEKVGLWRVFKYSCSSIVGYIIYSFEILIKLKILSEISEQRIINPINKPEYHLE